MQKTSLYIDRDSFLHKLSPFSKLAYILLSGAIVYSFKTEWFPIAIYLLLNLTIAAYCKILRPIWKYSWKVILPLCFFMLPIHGLLYPYNETPIASFEFITIYKEGILFAFQIILQLSCVLISALFFVLTTRPSDFIAATTQAGWSPVLTYLMGSPLLLLPAMRARIHKIQASQRARGLNSEGNLFQRIKGIKPLLYPFIIGSFLEIDQRTIALEIRGFNSGMKTTTIRNIPDTKIEKYGRIIAVIISSILICYRIIN